MTAEMQKKLQDKMKEEITDAGFYCDLADSAKEEGDLYLAKGLYAITKDEYTHAAFLRDYLIDHGMAVTVDQETQWTMLENKLSRKFRHH